VVQSLGNRQWGELPTCELNQLALSLKLLDQQLIPEVVQPMGKTFFRIRFPVDIPLIKFLLVIMRVCNLSHKEVDLPLLLTAVVINDAHDRRNMQVCLLIPCSIFVFYDLLKRFLLIRIQAKFYELNSVQTEGDK
jgi:hypothetical protein